jgi:hypothetical protein
VAERTIEKKEDRRGERKTGNWGGMRAGRKVGRRRVSVLGTMRFLCVPERSESVLKEVCR